MPIGVPRVVATKLNVSRHLVPQGVPCIELRSLSDDGELVQSGGFPFVK